MSSDPINLGTPLAASILMHHYAVLSPWPVPSPAATEEHERLQAAGVLMRDYQRESGWRTTQRGDAWVRDLLARCCPVLAFVNDDGEVV